MQQPPLIRAAPASVRLTQKQRKAVIFLAFAVPFWIILSLLAMASPLAMLVFLGGLFVLVVIYGMRTEYLLFLWFATNEYNEVLKWILGVQVLGVGIKGLFFIAVLTQLPNKFSLMPRKLFRSVPARWPFYLLLLWTGASVFWSDWPLYGFNRYLTWVMTFFFYALVFLTINDRNKRLFFIVFAVLVGSSVLFGLMQRFGLSISFAEPEAVMARSAFSTESWVGGENPLIFRATGFAGQPNMFGRECVLLFSVLLMMLISWRLRLVWRGVIVGMLGLTAATVVLSMSRAAWGYLTVGTIVFILFARPRWLLLLAVVAAIIVLVAWPAIWARLEPWLSGTDGSFRVRQYANRIYMEYWRRQPITGFGFGSSSGGALFEARISPHGGYVWLLTYTGLTGLVLYSALLLAVARRTWKVLHDKLVRADPELRTMAALGVGIVSILTLNYVYRAFMLLPVWYLLAASLAALRIAHGRQAQLNEAVGPNQPSGAARSTTQAKALRLGER